MSGTCASACGHAHADAHGDGDGDVEIPIIFIHSDDCIPQAQTAPDRPHAELAFGVVSANSNDSNNNDSNNNDDNNDDHTDQNDETNDNINSDIEANAQSNVPQQHRQQQTQSDLASSRDTSTRSALRTVPQAAPQDAPQPLPAGHNEAPDENHQAALLSENTGSEHHLSHILNGDVTIFAVGIDDDENCMGVSRDVPSGTEDTRSASLTTESNANESVPASTDNGVANNITIRISDGGLSVVSVARERQSDPATRRSNRMGLAVCYGACLIIAIGAVFIVTGVLDVALDDGYWHRPVVWGNYSNTAVFKLPDSPLPIGSNDTLMWSYGGSFSDVSCGQHCDIYYGSDVVAYIHFIHTLDVLPQPDDYSWRSNCACVMYRMADCASQIDFISDARGLMRSKVPIPSEECPTSPGA